MTVYPCRFGGLLLACLVLAAGCSVAVPGEPLASRKALGDGKHPADYTYPTDGSGFGKGELDQPQPVPSSTWVGWDGDTTNLCAVAVELAPGRLLRIQYHDTLNEGSGCLFARSMVVEALSKLLDKTA
jgi:hypothetical protein